MKPDIVLNKMCIRDSSDIVHTFSGCHDVFLYRRRHFEILCILETLVWRIATDVYKRQHIDRKDMQYLYADDDFYHFMDVETYDQIDLPKDEVCLLYTSESYVFA